MNSKIEAYKTQLGKLTEWDDFLTTNSNLPSPRSNLELLAAAVEVGTKDTFLKYLSITSNLAPVNDPGEFLCTIGVAGLGKLINEGDPEGVLLAKLKQFTSDPRWRVREGVAIALQVIGKKNMNHLLTIVSDWIQSDLFAQRAVVAGLCEPILLKNQLHAKRVLADLYQITLNLKDQVSKRKTEEFRILKKALSYGWSVAIVASPQKGKNYFEILMKDNNIDLRNILKENLSKNRLIRMDAGWVKEMLKEF